MPSHFRIKALAVVLAVFGLLACKATPALADAPVLCETNVGIPGQLLDGYFGVAYAPVEFDKAEVLRGRVAVFANLQGGPGVFVGAGEMIHLQQVDNATPTSNQAKIDFQRNDGTVVHQCQIDIVAYDPTAHDLAALQLGDCSGTVLAGLPQLVAGHAQVWAFPQDFAEISISPPRIADASTLSARSIYLIGKSPGMVIVARLKVQVDGGNEVSLCPFTVASQQQAFGLETLGDDAICRDLNGAPVRLTVGQTAILPMSQGEEHPVSFTDFAISAPDVLASLGYEKMGNSWTIKAIAPGTSSLTAVTPDGLHAMGCEVVVE